MRMMTQEMRRLPAFYFDYGMAWADITGRAAAAYHATYSAITIITRLPRHEIYLHDYFASLWLDEIRMDSFYIFILNLL